MSPCSVLMQSEVEHLSQASNAAGIDAAQSLRLPARKPTRRCRSCRSEASFLSVSGALSAATSFGRIAAFG